MSHTTRLKAVVIRDVSALHTAVSKLKSMGVNCDLVQNAKPRMYYGNQHGECAHVLKLHDSQYDVGLEAQQDGSFVPVFDEWGGHVSRQIGAGKSCPMPNTTEGKAQHAIGKFFQSYAEAAAINAATTQGYFVESTTTDEHGNVHLVLGGL
jgi:hypothetical protein